MKRGIDYKHVVRSVKYPRLEFKSGELQVVAPKNADIASLLMKHEKWIKEKQSFVRKNTHNSKVAIKEKNEELLRKSVERHIKKTEKLLNVAHKSYRFRKMKTKWASCNSEGVITYNEIVKYLPDSLLLYITLHEMAHLIVKDHNKKFWHLVNRHIKNSEAKERKLYAYWFSLYKN
jgi:predicted metal-dependent hydrolase